jgi:hypothetical protein
MPMRSLLIDVAEHHSLTGTVGHVGGGVCMVTKGAQMPVALRERPAIAGYDSHPRRGGN